jgi:hypothetical protein
LEERQKRQDYDVGISVLMYKIIWIAKCPRWDWVQFRFIVSD